MRVADLRFTAGEARKLLNRLWITLFCPVRRAVTWCGRSGSRSAPRWQPLFPLAKIKDLGVPLLSVNPGPGQSVVDQQAVICDEARGSV